MYQTTLGKLLYFGCNVAFIALIISFMLENLKCLNMFAFCSTFGSVEDVRIPCQQRRMFGFVTFVEPETVKMILDKGNPHYVRGSRVLVKPYKEKPKLIDR